MGSTSVPVSVSIPTMPPKPPAPSVPRGGGPPPASSPHAMRSGELAAHAASKRRRALSRRVERPRRGSFICRAPADSVRVDPVVAGANAGCASGPYFLQVMLILVAAVTSRHPSLSTARCGAFQLEHGTWADFGLANASSDRPHCVRRVLRWVALPLARQSLSSWARSEKSPRCRKVAASSQPATSLAASRTGRVGAFRQLGRLRI